MEEDGLGLAQPSCFVKEKEKKNTNVICIPRFPLSKILKQKREPYLSQTGPSKSLLLISKSFIDKEIKGAKKEKFIVFSFRI